MCDEFHCEFIRCETSMWGWRSPRFAHKCKYSKNKNMVKCSLFCEFLFLICFV